MIQLYSKKEVDKKALKGARIAVLGYGSQGRAHALNLKDSGFNVVVGVRKSGKSWKQAKRDVEAAVLQIQRVGAPLAAIPQHRNARALERFLVDFFFRIQLNHSKLQGDKQKTPHRRPVRGFGVCSFPGIRNA